MSGRNQGNAFANENRNEIDFKFVDFACIEKGSDNPGSAHHPDVLPGIPDASARAKALTGSIDELRLPKPPPTAVELRVKT